MLLIVLSIAVGIFAVAVLAMMTVGTDTSKRVNCKARRVGSGGSRQRIMRRRSPIFAEARKD